MKLPDYLALLDDAERRLVDTFELLAARHAADADIRDTARRLAQWSFEKRASLGPARDTYGRTGSRDTDRLYDALLRPRPGGFGLLRDLHDASLLVHHAHLAWVAVGQAAQALIDHSLIELCERSIVRTDRQARWVRTNLRVASAQALTVVPDKASELRATLQNMRPRLALVGAVAGAASLAIAAVAVLRRTSR